MYALVTFLFLLIAQNVGATPTCMINATDGDPQYNRPTKLLLKLDITKPEAMLVLSNGRIERDFSRNAPTAKQLRVMKDQVVLSFSPLPNDGVRVEHGQVREYVLDSTTGVEYVDNAASGQAPAGGQILAIEIPARKLGVVCHGN